MTNICDILILVAYMYLLFYGKVYQIMYCVRGCIDRCLYNHASGVLYYFA